jgi:ribosomal protein L11 methyltransferase
MIQLTGRVVLANPSEEISNGDIIIRLVPAFPDSAFGYGWHSITKKMVEKIQNLDFTGKAVYDIGTGCGIQAILAKKLGAEKVVAVEKSPMALRVARKNADLNNVKIDFLEQDAKTLNANIADVVIYTLDDKEPDKFKHILKEGGDYYVVET